MSDEAPPPDAVVTVTLGDGPPLQPADPADVTWTLAFALQYRGRKRVNTAADAMARITAERLVEHLRVSGYVVMKKPPPPLHSDAGANR